MSKKYPHVYLDIMIGSEAGGRIVFELFSDLTPRTAENFKGLCTGEYGTTTIDGRTCKLSYQGSQFHRIVDGFIVQGGDIVSGDGTGSVSIYGKHFNDENFSRRHSCAGLLSMANCGRNSNGSQFFITLRAAPHLDGKHVVFGQVVDGMDVVRKMGRVPIDHNDRPKIPITVYQCSSLDDARGYIWNDPFSKQTFEDILEKKRRIEEDTHKKIDKIARDAEEEDGGEQHQKDQEKAQQIALESQLNKMKRELEDSEKQEENEKSNIHIDEQKLSQEKQDRLLNLRLRINEARRLNTKAVVQEERELADPNYQKSKKLEKIREKNEQRQKELEYKGLTDKTYLTQSASRAEHAFAAYEKKKQNDVFGWNVFNQDTLYKAYEKRCKAELQFDQELYRKQVEQGVEGTPNVEAMDRVANSILKQDAKLGKFSRRRAFNEEADVNYINEGNRFYNEKLQRHFGQYVVDLKTSLERKTAE